MVLFFYTYYHLEVRWQWM